ncbi:uncharacterized protein LOC129231516 [Uloborus diversus]|uniref:uncharacterized protein LOC129231516 n=1 Tax=Uloborus diversus TaxID=327109 RepID=UPI002409E9A9|nr:uncharacterized protein LOC129231516 [Uloborus diversus]
MASPRKRQRVNPAEESLRRVSRGVAEVDSEGRTQLHLAAERGDSKRIRELLELGYNPHVIDNFLWRPIVSALIHKKEAAAEILTEFDAKLCLQTLYIAACRGFWTAARLLLLRGLHPQEKTKDQPEANGKDTLDQVFANFDYEPDESEPDDEVYEKLLEIVIASYIWKNMKIDFSRLQDRPKRKQRCMRIVSQCETEMRRMRDTRVVEGSQVFFFDIAARPTRRVSIYLDNPRIREVLHSDRITADFPYYGPFIALKIWKAEERKALRDKFLYCFTRKLHILPDTFADMLLRVLRDNELESFIQAFRSEQQ